MTKHIATTIMLFISLDQFRVKAGLKDGAAINVVKSNTTEKLFAITDAGTFKVQQNLSKELPIRFMYESEDKFSEGCISNVVPPTAVMTL